MAEVPDALPYGLRRIMLTPYLDDQGTILGPQSYRLPVAQTLAFSETEEYDELRGDDKLVAIHGRGAQVDGSFEAGGLSIVAWSILSGAQVIEEGVAPLRKTRLRKRGTDSRPYFRTDGQVISDSGGDLHARIYRCKCSGRLTADFRGGAFQTTAMDFRGLPMPDDENDVLYEITRNETKTAISTTPEANPLPTPSDLTVGTITATSVALVWLDIEQADSFVVEKATGPDFDNWTDVASGAGGEPTGNSTTVTGLTASTPYQFRVRGIFDTVDGDPSEAVVATTIA